MKFKVLKKSIIVTAITMMIGTSGTVMAAEYTVTPVQTVAAVKANTMVYATAELTNPTQCILPEDFPVTVTGVSSTGFWEIDINGIKFYIVGEAVKTTAETSQSQEVQTQVPAVVTTGMKNALKKAQSYLKHSAFSRQGLIEQLKYEGYTDEESIYGADFSGADWNAQSLKKAQSYLKHSAFSRQGLIEQLKYEGFTDAQSIYGTDNAGANWYEECSEKAQSYLKHSSFSRDGLINQLKYEGFTDAEIAYGIVTVGY